MCRPTFPSLAPRNRPEPPPTASRQRVTMTNIYQWPAAPRQFMVTTPAPSGLLMRRGWDTLPPMVVEERHW
ncbi:uncharacterized protein BDV14DRAFT_185703 [Aspergillus stella-maris]|uniref:uncharacterized protein n=1 Tax=Aspergillus stella-maris TaxID=1810926 RepID=UPI003CCCA254